MKHHTYLINMDDSPSRLERCATQLQERGVAFTRIPGVDVRKQPELKQQHYSAERNRWHHRSELTDGEIGCSLSHRIAWQQIIDDEIEFGLVLEDDFEIVADLNPVLEVIAGLEFDWHLLKLMEGPVASSKEKKDKGYPNSRRTQSSELRQATRVHSSTSRFTRRCLEASRAVHGILSPYRCRYTVVQPRWSACARYQALPH